MSTIEEALQATLEQRYREAVQMNVQLQEQLDGAKVDLKMAARVITQQEAELIAEENLVAALQGQMAKMAEQHVEVSRG